MQHKYRIVRQKPTHRSFGGSHLKRGNPRGRRPLRLGMPTHVVMKSSLAVGPFSMLRPKYKRPIDELVRRLAKQFGVRIYDFVNVGNHLHFMVTFETRKALQHWLRAIGGVIPRRVLGCERGSPKPVEFWDWRPWTVYLELDRSLDRLTRYMRKNLKQAVARESAVQFYDIYPDTG